MHGGEAGSWQLAGLLETSHPLPHLPSPSLQLGMFMLQLGVLATFLSEPVVKALTSGAALHVLVSQLPSLLGLSLPRQIGCFSLFKVGVGKEVSRSHRKGATRRGGGEGGGIGQATRKERKEPLCYVRALER